MSHLVLTFAFILVLPKLKGTKETCLNLRRPRVLSFSSNLIIIIILCNLNFQTNSCKRKLTVVKITSLLFLFFEYSYFLPRLSGQKCRNYSSHCFPVFLKTYGHKGILILLPKSFKSIFFTATAQS